MKTDMLSLQNINSLSYHISKQKFAKEIQSGRLSYTLYQFIEALFFISSMSLQWRHNRCDGVSHHRPRDCLLNRCSGADQRKHQSSVSLAFVRGIHRWSGNSPHKWPVTWKMFPFDDVIMLVFECAISGKLLTSNLCECVSGLFARSSALFPCASFQIECS